MRYFTVTVHPKRVQIEEIVKPFTSYDFLATVDGAKWHYKIKKSPNIAKNDRHWRGRANQNIYYHANNSGVKVHFNPVPHSRTRKRKIHAKQLPLW